MFYKAAESNRFECFLESNTRLPMIYLPDCLRATVEFLETPSENLKLRTYNVTGMSFTPAELLQTLEKYYPKLKVTYAPDYRQGIGEWCWTDNLLPHVYHLMCFPFSADSWPQVFDDSGARADWGWKPEYDLDGLVSDMVKRIDPKTFQQS